MFVETKREGEAMEKWQQILLTAADLLEQHGWIQGHRRTNRGRCVLGAIDFHWDQVNEVDKWNALTKILAHINLFTQDNTWSLAAWNDEPGRTKAEVITALRAAAKG
jgi:hypothetical protein